MRPWSWCGRVRRRAHAHGSTSSTAPSISNRLAYSVILSALYLRAARLQLRRQALLGSFEVAAAAFLRNRPERRSDLTHPKSGTYEAPDNAWEAPP